MPIQVPEIDPNVDPLFVLTRRASGRRLEGYEVALHEDIFDDLRSIGADALSTLEGMESRDYEPTAEIEPGEECFTVDTADLPSPQHGTDEAVNSEVADLLAIVSDPTVLESISAADLGTERYLAYGVVLTDVAGHRIGFFRQEDPARPIRRGRVFGRFTDALRKVEAPPNLVLYPDIDVIVTAERIHVLRKIAFTRLLADVDLAIAEVGANVEEVASRLGTQMPLAPGVGDILRGVAVRRPSFALRLQRLSGRAQQLADAGVTGTQIRQAIVAVDGNPDDLLNEDDVFEFNEEGVGAFLDVIEGRWFKDSLGGEARRADRYSRRRN